MKLKKVPRGWVITRIILNMDAAGKLCSMNATSVVFVLDMR